MNRPAPRAGKAPPAVDERLTRELARAFIHALRLRLTVEELTEIRLRNQEELDDDACHTFDFCEPLDAMKQAAWSLGLTPASHLGDPEARARAEEIEHIAWSLAKSARFVSELVR